MVFFFQVLVFVHACYPGSLATRLVSFFCVFFWGVRLNFQVGFWHAFLLGKQTIPNFIQGCTQKKHTSPKLVGIIYPDGLYRIPRWHPRWSFETGSWVGLWQFPAAYLLAVEIQSWWMSPSKESQTPPALRCSFGWEPAKIEYIEISHVVGWPPFPLVTTRIAAEDARNWVEIQLGNFLYVGNFFWNNS